jgi:phosphatidylglycerophosphate synthase
MHHPPKQFQYDQATKEGHQLPLLRYLAVDRYIDRPMGALIARAVFNTRVTPNQLTYLSFVLLAAAAGLMCVNDRRWIVAGALLQLVANFVDAADGMLARSKGLSSRFGGTLDLMLDRIGDWLVYGSGIVAYYHVTGDPWLALGGLVGLALFNLQVTLYYLVEQYRKADRTGMSGESRALIAWVLAVCVVAGRFDVLMWLMMLEPVGNILYRVWYFHQLPRDSV